MTAADRRPGPPRPVLPALPSLPPLGCAYCSTSAWLWVEGGQSAGEGVYRAVAVCPRHEARGRAACASAGAVRTSPVVPRAGAWEQLTLDTLDRVDRVEGAEAEGGDR